ncbi:MAG: hypothetical protein IPK27_13265 [Rhodanobacteraceae bacterium]|nr:hypothetical protein [Rhodanobacteraceae bacterium]
MSAFGVFVVLVMLAWGATIWALRIEFRAQAYRERNLPEASRGPFVDHEHLAFWRNGGQHPPGGPRRAEESQVRLCAPCREREHPGEQSP